MSKITNLGEIVGRYNSVFNGIDDDIAMDGSGELAGVIWNHYCEHARDLLAEYELTMSSFIMLVEERTSEKWVYVNMVIADVASLPRRI